MTTNLPQLGANLRIMRQNIGMSLERAGKAADLSGESLRDIELGRADPWIDTLRKLSRAYGESITIEIGT